MTLRRLVAALIAGTTLTFLVAPNFTLNVASAAKPTASPSPSSANPGNKPSMPKSTPPSNSASPNKDSSTGSSSTSGNSSKITAPKTDATIPISSNPQSKIKNPTGGIKSSYIVRFVEGTNVANEVAELAKSKISVSRKFGFVFKGLVAELTDGQRAALEKRSSVISIVPDEKISIEESQDFAPWGLDRVDQVDLPLQSRYDYVSTGSGVKVYVVDTGIRQTHQEFGTRVNSGFSAIDDGNGTTDCNGHGTHVASTVGGKTYGIAKDVTLVAVRALDCSGNGTSSGVIAGLDWIAQTHPANYPAVVNMSLGGGSNPSLDSAVAALISRGISVVVAAGNSADDACKYSPARVPGAITVGATTSADQFANYSNFGSCVDILAPGTSITGAWITSDSDSRTISGTSMATPHVAGVVARLLSLANQSPSAIAESLTSSSSREKISALPALTANLLLYKSPLEILPGTPTLPNPATQLIALGGVKQATLSWTLGEVGTSPVTSQVVNLWLNGQLVKSYSVGTKDTRFTATKLRAAKGYYFTVVTISSGGRVESSRSDLVTVSNR